MRAEFSFGDQAAVGQSRRAPGWTWTFEGRAFLSLTLSVPRDSFQVNTVSFSPFCYHSISSCEAAFLKPCIAAIRLCPLH